MNSLCQLAADWRGSTPTGGMLFEEKVDGWRALRLAGIDGKVRLWTRNGMPIEGVSHILQRLAAMETAAGEPMFFDGEFQVDDTLADTKAWCETRWKQGGTAGIFHAFDCMTLAEWRAGGTDRPLIERKAMLRRLFDESEPEDDGWTWAEGSRGAPTPTAVQIVPDSWAFDAADVVSEARRVWAEKGEGLMLKDAESPYQRRRCDAWQKVKAENMHKWARRPIAA